MSVSCFTSTNSHLCKFLRTTGRDWRNTIYIECGDCQRAVSRSCRNLLCAFDSTGAPVIVPELYKGWIDEHIRDPHACPLNDLYVNWDVPDPCAARIFLNR